MSLISEALRKARTDAALRDRRGDDLPASVRLMQHGPASHGPGAGPMLLAGLGLLLVMGACVAMAVPQWRDALFGPPRAAVGGDAEDEWAQAVVPDAEDRGTTGGRGGIGEEDEAELARAMERLLGPGGEGGRLEGRPGDGASRSAQAKPSAVEDEQPGPDGRDAPETPQTPGLATADEGGDGELPRLVHVPALHGPGPPLRRGTLGEVEGGAEAMDPGMAWWHEPGPLEHADAVPPPPGSGDEKAGGDGSEAAEAGGEDDERSDGDGGDASSDSRPSEPIAGRHYRERVEIDGLPRLRLDGITWSGEDRPAAALINQMVVQPGDEIDGYEVVVIERRRIKLRWQDVEFYLAMP